MTADRNTQTAAVLDEMVAGIMGVKAEKATKLTPLPGEQVKMPPMWPTDLNGPGQPKGFMSHETMRDAAKDLRRHAQSLLDIAEALDGYSGFPTGAIADPKQVATEATKREEREADARAAAEPTFAERFATLQAEAQAAVFSPAALDADEDEPESESDWVCSTHGDKDIRGLTSRKGRPYKACGVPNCKEFER